MCNLRFSCAATPACSWSRTRPARKARKCAASLIEEGADIKKEYYVGIVTDRGTQRVCVMASSEGGMDIEEVAAHSPEKILKVFVDPAAGLTDAEAAELARGIGAPEASVGQGCRRIPEAVQGVLGHRRPLAGNQP